MNDVFSALAQGLMAGAGAHWDYLQQQKQADAKEAKDTVMNDVNAEIARQAAQTKRLNEQFMATLKPPTHYRVNNTSKGKTTQSTYSQQYDPATGQYVSSLLGTADITKHTGDAGGPPKPKPITSSEFNSVLSGASPTQKRDAHIWLQSNPTATLADLSRAVMSN